MDQHATWYGGRPQPRRLCVRWGPCFPSPKGEQSPQFSANVLPSPKGEQSPQFSANVRYGQTTGWTKMALGIGRSASAQATLCSMETQLPPEQRAHPPPPSFGPCLLWPNGWMDEDTTWYGSRPRPRHIVSDGIPALREAGTEPPSFRPCLLWPRLPISDTAELLYKRSPK